MRLLQSPLAEASAALHKLCMRDLPSSFDYAAEYSHQEELQHTDKAFPK